MHFLEGEIRAFPSAITPEQRYLVIITQLALIFSQHLGQGALIPHGPFITMVLHNQTRL